MTSSEGTTLSPQYSSHCPTLPTCNPSDNPLLLHAGDREYILFSFWKTGSHIGLFGSCLLVILLCILYEAIDLCRNFLAREHAICHPGNEDSTSLVSSSFNGRKSFCNKLRGALNSYRLTQATLYGIQTIFNGVIFLIIVTFNFWLILSVAIGKAIGYFIFSGSPVVERTTIPLATSSPLPMRRSDIQCPTISSYVNNSQFHSSECS